MRISRRIAHLPGSRKQPFLFRHYLSNQARLNVCYALSRESELPLFLRDPIVLVGKTNSEEKEMAATLRFLRVFGLVVLYIPFIQNYALAQGDLTNGGNATGSISGLTEKVTWTFAAKKGDDITVSISEIGPNTAFVPLFQLIGADGTNYGYSWGDLSAQRHITGGSTGTYKVIVSRNDSAKSVGNYSLTLARSPAAFVVPQGDQGGAMVNGQNYSGSILRGDLDQWSFSANKGDDITVSISESGVNTAFVPMIQLIGPDGTDYGYSWGDLSAQRHITSAVAGTYQVVVSRNDSADGVGAYLLNMARSPAAFVVPSGDEGGPMNNGQNYLGTILRGDLDQWSFSANKGDDVTVSISEAGTNTAFVPMIQLIGPDGTDYGYSWGDLSAHRYITCPLTGIYKVVVSRNDSADGVGHYLLTMALASATFVVPGGDQGGPMTDGQSYSGAILRGDLDQWSFTANKDDDIRVSISEEGGNTAFVPMIQLIGPDGTNYGYSWGDLSAERHITASATGAYTVVVSRNDAADGVGAYFLTFAKSPGTFVVPTGDQGGAMNNGQNYAGSILRGDLDEWSFNANKGDDVTVSISEVGKNTAFVPMIQVVGPDGTDFGFSWGDLWAQRHITANATGAYTVVVSRNDSADGVGNYLLNMARSPAAFVVPAGDQGGPMNIGQTYTGSILRGDLDQWSFSAVKGNSITVTVRETGTNTPFVPLIQLIGPDGTNYGYSWGDTSAQRSIIAGASGAYKVVVSRNDADDGIGNYSLLVTGPAKAPSPVVQPATNDQTSATEPAPMPQR